MGMEITNTEKKSPLATLLDSIENQIQSKKSEGKLSVGHNKQSDLLIEQLANDEELITFFRDHPDHINMSAAATAMVTAAAAAIAAAAALKAKGKKTEPEQINLIDANTKGLNINELLSLRVSCL